MRGKQLRQKLFRPDVVSKAIELASATEAIKSLGLGGVEVGSILRARPPELTLEAADPSASGGHGSIIVARDRHWFVNTSGNPGMASAGMGDVLSGILGALLTQKYTGETSLVLGTHLHGCAADECVRAGAGPVGLTAGELIAPARRIWNSWLSST